MPGIFISYRRNDVAGQVGRLFGRLTAHYGEDFVFMDVESINPSQQFESVIQNRIKDCDVMLLAIGPTWTAGRDSPDGVKDFVHMEITEALASKRALCPLMIDRAEMLDATTLPVGLQDVLSRNAFEIRHSTFGRDVDALIAGLEKLGVRPPPTVGRRRFEAALLAAGWPYSWFGAASRVLRPGGAVAALLLALAGAGVLGYQSAFDRGQSAGVVKGRAEATKSYEEISSRESRASLRIPVFVTDGTRGVEDASIKIVNLSNGKSDTARSDSNGLYPVDLAKIEISEGDVVEIEVTKQGYQTTREHPTYDLGFRQFRAILKK